MEGLKLRVFVFAALMLVLGVLVWAAPRANTVNRSESWMEQRMPDTVGNFRYRRSADNPEQSYRMDQTTYDVLKPFGIVCRVYEFAGRAYDVVVIASRDKDSFHDPRVCFTAGGFAIRLEQRGMIKTKTRGLVPVTIAHLSSDRGQQSSVFFYRGPGGFTATTMGLKWDMFKEQFGGGDNIDGVFYRIIPLNRGTTDEELARFVGQFLDEAKVTSDGYF
jgi:hypothetical protein